MQKNNRIIACLGFGRKYFPGLQIYEGRTYVFALAQRFTDNPSCTGHRADTQVRPYGLSRNWKWTLRLFRQSRKGD